MLPQIATAEPRTAEPSAPSLAKRYSYLAANLVLLWLAVLIYRTNRYYDHFLAEQTKGLLVWLAAGYTGFGVVFYSLRRDLQPSRGYIGLMAIWKRLKDLRLYLRDFPLNPALRIAPLSNTERTTLLFLLVKFIYLPMMIEFTVANWGLIQSGLWLLRNTTPQASFRYFNLVIFPLAIDTMFVVECVLYSFGYAFESSRLKNQVKSVEPTVLGWVAALCCYPPFNGFINNYVSWYTSDAPEFSSELFSGVIRAAVLVLFAIYLWGALSLGTRCSNLTNRGIVTTGAFSLVRHPSYAAKNFAWWLGLLPALSNHALIIPALGSMAFWSFLYFLRAITEERHLLADPDYQEYCRKVRYRFIPGVV
jgi:protein-S-isoprenylcysteine O-methyltransferase Ste14